jgi:hypothetical protein
MEWFLRLITWAAMTLRGGILFDQAAVVPVGSKHGA